MIFLETLADDETGKLGEMEPRRACLTLKGAVYTVWIFICILHVSEGVPIRKKDEVLD